MVGQRRIFAGEWQVNTHPTPAARSITQICLRYPGVRLSGPQPDWSCRPAGTMFYEMAQREAGDPLRFGGRTQALFVLEKTPANLAEVEARVRN